MNTELPFEWRNQGRSIYQDRNAAISHFEFAKKMMEETARSEYRQKLKSGFVEITPLCKEHVRIVECVEQFGGYAECFRTGQVFIECEFVATIQKVTT